jgi:2-polyprenyl-3-methyl-5-hydroxy-6-metoxy-1,4-benzoquinol methylase
MSLIGRILRRMQNRIRACSRPFSIRLRYSLFGARIDRDQWQAPSAESVANYRRQMTDSWGQIRESSPDYFARLSASVERTHGRVLEVGCGMGNMTRWIAARPEVSAVTAIDGAGAAIEMLKDYRLPKVQALAMPIDAIELEGSAFDCLVLCETLEHLYPDEERALLDAVLPLMTPGATYVVSVPIGWLEDPHHVRAFSRAGFRRHLERYYGVPADIDHASRYSQVAWGEIGGRAQPARAAEAAPVKSAS